MLSIQILGLTWGVKLIVYNLLIAVGKTQLQPHWRGSPVGLGWLEQAIEFFGVCVALCLISAKLAVMSIFVQC